MNRFSESLLSKLLDQYERSVLSKQGSERNIGIKIKTSDSVFAPYKNFRSSQDAEQQLEELERLSFITIEKDRNDNILSISLVPSSIDAIYKKIGREKPSDAVHEVQSYLESLKCKGTVEKLACDEIAFIKKNFRIHSKLYSDLQDLKNLVRCIIAIETLEDGTMERDFSVRVFDDSKIFSTTYRSRVISIFRKYNAELNDLDDDEVLAELNLFKNSTYVIIKNNLVFKLNRQIIDLNKMGFEFSLSDEMIKEMRIISSSSDKIITVENLTSFRMLNEPNAIIVFLSGFHNHTKQMLLKRLYEAFPEQQYYHFGDIDVGGMEIFRNLSSATGIPFKPYRMSVTEIEQNKDHLKALTDHDIERLQKMRNQDEFRVFQSVIDYMLTNRIKLEQEALD